MGSRIDAGALFCVQFNGQSVCYNSGRRTAVPEECQSKKGHSMKKQKEKRTIRRGDIYYADLSRTEKTRGSEQHGRRPVLIIQNDIGNQYAPTTIVAILTSQKKKYLPTHVALPNFAGLSKSSTVCLEQIKTIDKSRLEEYRGNVGAQTMKEVEKAIAVSLGTNFLSAD